MRRRKFQAMKYGGGTLARLVDRRLGRSRSRAGSLVHALVLVLVSVLATLAQAAPKTAASQPSAAVGDALEKAIAILIDQSNTFTSEPGDPVTLEFRRPQKFIAELPPEAAPLALQRMTKPFTGNEIKDNYIRFHLIGPILDAKPEHRKESGKHLIDLLK